MKNVFIIVPAADLSGPVKGAYALANQLVNRVPVNFVVLKGIGNCEAHLDSRVKIVAMSRFGSVISRVIALKNMLQDAGGRKRCISISFCFSADCCNFWMRKFSYTFSSIRGNLFVNYFHDYGYLGYLLAIVHLLIAGAGDSVSAMTKAMANQITPFCREKPVVIGNFVDENMLDKYRRSSSRTDGCIRLIFVGSLTTRKCPHLLIRAVHELLLQQIRVRLDIVGEGPLQESLLNQISELGISDNVVLHGFSEAPYELVSCADIFVLPSLSEGISRAVMEALHLGKVCVVRNVDGNSELIQDGRNGVVFNGDNEISDAILMAIELSKSHHGSGSLLPEQFRATQALRYLDVGV